MGVKATMEPKLDEWFKGVNLLDDGRVNGSQK